LRRSIVEKLRNISVDLNLKFRQEIDLVNCPPINREVLGQFHSLTFSQSIVVEIVTADNVLRPRFGVGQMELTKMDEEKSIETASEARG
jgi:hypothetical protein